MYSKKYDTIYNEQSMISTINVHKAKMFIISGEYLFKCSFLYEKLLKWFKRRVC